MYVDACFLETLFLQMVCLMTYMRRTIPRLLFVKPGKDGQLGWIYHVGSRDLSCYAQIREIGKLSR